MKSLRMLKHCRVTVGLDTHKLLKDKKFLGRLYSMLNHCNLLDFRPILRKEHGCLYQFEFCYRWEGAYRSMGAYRDAYGMFYFV